MDLEGDIKGVLTISAMSGYLPISQWIRQYSEMVEMWLCFQQANVPDRGRNTARWYNFSDTCQYDLDGLQKALADRYKRHHVNGKLYSPMVNLVRYADDLSSLARTRKLLKMKSSHWLLNLCLKEV